jgi:photosystem II stability/assembly factor-like uncharacterized protein
MPLDFLSLYTLDARYAWAGAGGGPAWRTQDGGATWSLVDLLAGGNDVSFVDRQNGWRLTGEYWGLSLVQFDISSLVTTDDGGRSWQLLKRTGWADARFSFVDTKTGWAIACTAAYCDRAQAQRALIKTTDGGRTWHLIRPKLIP